ncbi:hypothetical protein CGLAU_01240 [Corynebacterium glaucum]|uniref:Type VII secretion integral membrane protein EccD n=1 Tax=Corynebacterium glaucum TaxID=187491 RepID=A0A1Q2HTS6_9CORY|nr:EsaB/YukD family protein [Corynebacterium glaucum]AQQ14239.1 hypothetical protein CGLAU_01240 [Corynebacterium glaucum]WJZ06762.1 hypothetical protein CGLAUT_01260 [Corynebacterium glaucum]
MSDTFVRVSVFYADRQLDVSLPMGRPAVDIVGDVVDLFNHDAASNDSGDPQKAISTTDTHTWVLSTSKVGTIEPHATLAEYGIQDGDRLHLTRREEAAHTPFVDDAIAEVRATIDAAQWGWSGSMRSSSALATFVAGLAAAGAIAAAGIWNATLPLDATQWIQICIVVATAAIGLGMALWRKHEWMRYLGYAVPATTVLLTRVFLAQLPLEQSVPWTVAAVALSTAIAVWAAGRNEPASGTAGITAALGVAAGAALVAGGTMLGANIFAIFAWSAWLPVFLLLAAPTMGLNATGLPALIRQNDTGDPVARETIRVHARRAEAVSRGVAWAAAGLALAAAACLSASPVWQHGLIVLLLTAAVLLRQNGFADARAVGVLSFVGVVSLALVAGSFVRWYRNDWHPLAQPTVWWAPTQSSEPWIWGAAILTLAVALLVMLALQLRERDEVQAARAARVINTVDVLVCLAVIPGILAAQGLYQYYWATT